MTKKIDMWAVISFTYPEYDDAGEFDSVVGVYDNKEDADSVAAQILEPTQVVETTYYDSNAHD